VKLKVTFEYDVGETVDFVIKKQETFYERQGIGDKRPGRK